MSSALSNKLIKKKKKLKLYWAEETLIHLFIIFLRVTIRLILKFYKFSSINKNRFWLLSWWVKVYLAYIVLSLSPPIVFLKFYQQQIRISNWMISHLEFKNKAF